MEAKNSNSSKIGPYRKSRPNSHKGNTMKNSLVWLNHLVMWIFISLMILSTQNVAQAQFPPGIGLTKACPGPAPVPPGTVFQCTFTVQDLGPDSVINLAVTNTVPCPDPPTCTGGVSQLIACFLLDPNSGLPT